MSDLNEAALHKYTLYGPAYKTDPYTTLRALRSEGPVCPLMGITGKKKVWFVSHYKEARQVLRDHKRFVTDIRNTYTPEEKAAQRPVPRLERYLRGHLLRRDWEDHTRLRNLLQAAFHKRAVEQMRPRIQHLAEALLDAVEDQHEMDLIEDFALPLPSQVILEILGFPTDHDHVARLRSWTEAITIHPQAVITPQERLETQAGFITYLRACFDERKANPQNDLMTHLVRAVQEGQLRKEEFFSMVTILLMAGHEPSVRMIGNSMLALLQHPEQLGMLKAHPTMLDRTIEELLRYDGSVERATPRFATEDLELGGQQISRGDTVIVILTSANRDEHVFENPDVLDVDRQARSHHLSFGYGPHFCVGASLARLEIKIAIETLLRRFPRLRLAVPVASLEWAILPVVRVISSLPVRWD